MAWSAQRLHIQRDPVLSKKPVGVIVMITPKGQRQEMLCLPLRYLNGWLFGISSARVKDEIWECLIRYQEECYQVLADAFLSHSTETAVSPPSSATLLQVCEMGLAIARMAEEQMEFDVRLVKSESGLEEAGVVVSDLTKRVGAIEKRMG